MVKACLFDLDGVVFNTEPLYTLFWHDMGRKYCPQIADFEYVIKGQTLVQIFDRYLPSEEEKQQKITQSLNDYEKNMPYDYVDGFENFIKDIQSKGIKTAIVTSSNLAKMENVYARHSEFKKYFNAILTSEDFSESKPSPDCFLKAAERLGVSTKDSVIFEDSAAGLRSGTASGARVIGLATTLPVDEIKVFTREVICDYKGFTLSVD